MKLEFSGPSVADSRNIGADPSRLINCYRRGTTDGSVIVPVMGMSNGDTFDDGAGTGGYPINSPVRALQEIEGVLYGVQAGWVYSDLGSSSPTALDFIDEDDPNTTMVGNNGEVCVVAGGKYFVDGTEPTAGAFSDFGSCDFLGQCTLLTERNGRRVQWSDPADATTLDALNFATTESRDDNNIRGMTFGPEYWIFKEKSIERWYQDETGGFSAIPGSTIDKGLRDFRLLARGDIGGFFVADDSKCYICAPGGVLEKVSVPGLDSAIINDTPRECFYYQDEGHEFYVVTFEDRPAWCFDMTTREWHERAQNVEDPWTASHAAAFDGSYWIGTTTGRLRELRRYGTDGSTNIADYEEGGTPTQLVRRVISRNLSFQGKRGKIAKLSFPMRTGYDGASAMLLVSRDRGITWGDPKVRTFDLGGYETQMTWRALGQFRNFACELRMTDNVYAPIDAACFLETA